MICFLFKTGIHLRDYQFLPLHLYLNDDHLSCLFQYPDTFHRGMRLQRGFRNRIVMTMQLQYGHEVLAVSLPADDISRFSSKIELRIIGSGSCKKYSGRILDQSRNGIITAIVQKGELCG